MLFVIGMISLGCATALDMTKTACDAVLGGSAGSAWCDELGSDKEE
jgi:hypothetical protein